MGLAGESLSGSQIRVVLDLDDQTAAYATAKTAGKKGKIIAYNQEAAVPRAPLIASAAITGARMKTAKVPGDIDVTGPLTIETTYELMPYLLYLCLGGKSYTGLSTPWTHLIEPALDLPTFQIERKIPFAGGTRYYVYNGCRVDTWALDYKASGFVTLTMTTSGGKFTDSDTEYDGAAADFRAGHKIHGQQLLKTSLKLDGVQTAELLDLKINGNNNLIKDDYPMGFGGYRGGNGPGGLLEVTVSGNLRLLTNATVALLDGEPHTLEFTHEHTAAVRSLATYLYAVQFDRTHPGAAGPGPLRLAFNGEAVLDADSKLMDFTIINDLDPADIA